MHRFVNRARIERHGHRISFVSARVEEVAVVHDGNRHQMASSVGRKFEKSQGARPCVAFLVGGLRRGKLRQGKLRCGQ